MRRTPIVITATFAGLAGVLAFHTTPAKLSLGALPGASGTAQPSAAASSGSSQRAQTAAGASSPPRSSPTAKAKPGTTRTVVGPAVNYNFGVLSVSVTVSGNKITKVGIASIDEGGNQRWCNWRPIRLECWRFVPAWSPESGSVSPADQ